MSAGRPWYKRFGADFVHGTLGLSLEEKGAYSLCLDLIYDRGGPIPDDARWLSGVCGVSVRKWTALRERLIDTGKLVVRDGVVFADIIEQWTEWAGRQPIAAEVRRLVYDRDGEVCAYCGSEDGPFHIDHIVPVASGGQNDPDNLTVACKPCNLSKGAKSISEWLQ